MTEINPACAVMTADCPPGNDCRLSAVACHAEITEGDNPNLSCYRYHCATCAKEWHVAWPQVQPILDRQGRVLNPPQPVVTPL